jgi:hypothetical protein
MKRAFLFFSLLGFAGLCLTGCLEELEDIDKIGGSAFEPTLEFPLVNSNFTMGDFIVDGNSKARIVEHEGVLTLFYDDSLTTPPASAFFFLPDQSSPDITITGGDFILPPGGSVTFTKALSFNFNPGGGEVLDSVVLKAGSLQLFLQSSIQANVSATFAIPSLHNAAGVAFTQTINFTTPSSSNPVADLSRYVMDLTDGGTTTNTLEFSITITVTSTGQAVTGSQDISCRFDLNDLQFGALFGDLGTRSFPVAADSLLVDLFTNASGSGSFELVSPSIDLSLRNSFGLPILFDIQSFSGHKTNTLPVFLNGNAVSAPLNPYLVGAPTYAQLGQSISSNIAINQTNSNLPAVLSFLPEFLGYEFNMGLNPGHASTKNFVLDTSRLTIGVHLMLPFYGSISGLTLTREFEFDGLGIDDIAQSKVRLKTVNGAPLDVAIQVYFTANDGTVLDSLFANPNILKAAPVGADGFATGTTEFSTDVQLTQAKVDRVEQAERLVIGARIASPGNGTVPVKFSPNNTFEVIIGVQTKMKYNLE